MMKTRVEFEDFTSKNSIVRRSPTFVILGLNLYISAK